MTTILEEKTTHLTPGKLDLVNKGGVELKYEGQIVQQIDVLFHQEDTWHSQTEYGEHDAIWMHWNTDHQVLVVNYRVGGETVRRIDFPASSISRVMVSYP